MILRPRFSRRTRFGGLAMVAVAAVVLAACGNPATKVTPTQAVSKGFGGVAAQSGVNIRVSLGVTAQQLEQMATTLGGSGSKLTSQIATTLTETSIDVDFNTGHGENIDSKQARTDSDDQFDFAVQIEGGAPVEIRYLDGKIYLHADLPTLLSDFGQPSSDATKFQNGLQSLNSYVPGIAALGQGQWVSAQTSAFAPLLKDLKTAEPAATPAASLKLVDQLRAALAANSNYVNEGTNGGRTEYAVTVQVHNFVQQAETDLSSSLSSLPGASDLTKGLTEAQNKIPTGQTAVFDLYVSNQRVQEIVIDLNQFIHKFTFPVPLQIQFNSGTSVAAPQGATALNLSKLSSLLGGLLGGATSTSN